MLHAMLKSVHLLAMFVWLGGMFFTLACLRPALGVLEPPQRARLMNAAMQRFFVAVSWAAGLMLASGVLMMSGRPTPAIAAMAAFGIVMIGVFVFVRLVPFKRLQAALAAGDASTAGAALNTIRRWVALNLAIGVAIVLITQFVPLV
jgi:uncharacterized membrane protein